MSCNNFSEMYDPNKPVCDNQSDFNMAFKKAVKYNNDQYMKKNKGWVIAYSVILIIFIVWALILVSRMNGGDNRVLHYVFAFLFSPIYVLSHYLNASEN